MYAKIFASMYDGSLRNNFEALVTFQQFLVLSTPDGVVDMHPEAISGRTGIPVELIKTGIAILEREDKESRTPDMEGRRIMRLDEHREWGWFIVNHRKYQELDKVEKKREADRVRIATKRAKNHAEHSDVAKCRKVSQKVAHTYTYTDTDLNKDKDIKKQTKTTASPSHAFVKPSVQEIKAFKSEHGLSIDAEAFRDYYESNGWMVGKSKMKDWKATARNWSRREGENNKAVTIPEDF